MLNMTVKELKNLATERGLCGYSKLRKAELLPLLHPIPTPRRDFSERPTPAPRRDFSERPTPALRRDFSERPIPAPRNILNIPNPEINVPILVPETVKVKPNVVKRVVDKTLDTFSGWMYWLAESGKNIV